MTVSNDDTRGLLPFPTDFKRMGIRWTGFPGEGMWSPVERAGWWIVFGADTVAPDQAFGAFPTERDARDYLIWAKTEARVNRNGQPAVVVALRSSGRVRVVEIIEASQTASRTLRGSLHAMV